MNPILFVIFSFYSFTKICQGISEVMRYSKEMSWEDRGGPLHFGFWVSDFGLCEKCSKFF